MSDQVVDRLTWFDRSDRVRLAIQGPDRAKFLHNLTTNDVKRLAIGSGHESFITSPQGKTLAFVTLLATDQAVLLRTDPRASDSFLPHLQKYGVFDDVEISDIAPTTFEVHLVGPGADLVVAGLGIDAMALAKPLQHSEIKNRNSMRVIREGPTGEQGWTLIGPLAERESILDGLAASGASPGDPSAFEALRIMAGTPVSGLDVQASNLPQEVGRDALAINFVKGCYLGQETVARLDALGHVNKILKGGTIEGTSEVPAAGTSLAGEDGKPVGAITSSAFSTAKNAPVFLAYVRVAQAMEGTRLSIPSMDGAVAVVTDLPKPN